MAGSGTRLHSSPLNLGFWHFATWILLCFDHLYISPPLSGQILVCLLCVCGILIVWKFKRKEQGSAFISLLLESDCLDHCSRMRVEIYIGLCYIVIGLCYNVFNFY